MTVGKKSEERRLASKKIKIKISCNSVTGSFFPVSTFSSIIMATEEFQRKRLLITRSNQPSLLVGSDCVLQANGNIQIPSSKEFTFIGSQSFTPKLIGGSYWSSKISFLFGELGPPKVLLSSSPPCSAKYHNASATPKDLCSLSCGFESFPLNFLYYLAHN